MRKSNTQLYTAPIEKPSVHSHKALIQTGSYVLHENNTSGDVQLTPATVERETNVATFVSRELKTEQILFNHVQHHNVSNILYSRGAPLMREN